MIELHGFICFVISVPVSKIGRINHNNTTKDNIIKNRHTLDKQPSRPSSVASKTSTINGITPKPRPASAIPTPCGVAKTYLTTEEVLAAVQEKSPVHQKLAGKIVV